MLSRTMLGAVAAASLLLPGFTGHKGAPILAGCTIVQRHHKPYPALVTLNGVYWQVTRCSFVKVVNGQVVQRATAR